LNLHPWNEPLLERLRGRALPHALLVHGAQGIGKLALAERIAQLVLCEAQDEARKPCGTCDGCRWFLAGNHPDFRFIEPSALSIRAAALGQSLPIQAVLQPYREEQARQALEDQEKRKPSHEIRIEQIRDLGDFLGIGSHRGARRVALVHPAEDMNVSAANALLKGLEEPPPAAMFILVAHRPARLLPTVRSRCVSLPVPLPAPDAARRWLEAQGLRDAVRWLAYAGGAPLRALAFGTQAETIDRMLAAIARRAENAVDDRESVEALAEALQKFALDRAFVVAGAAPKYGTPGAKPGAGWARAWLDYARAMGQSRALARHPLNPKLFVAEMIAAMPVEGKRE